MRADRLLAMLMLLQTRGRMTAQALADELEVSVRTIYRDVEALSISGVPVYAERGPGGGCALLDNYRTTLTGLNVEEVRALFMLDISAPLAELGLKRDLQAALLKLSAALPEASRVEETRVRQRLHLDSAGWGQVAAPAPFLPVLHQAVWQDRRLHLVIQATWPYTNRLSITVEPYGLVAKSGVWYLVCRREGGVRAYRATDLIDAELCETPFQRDPDFDLPAFWAGWCARQEAGRRDYPVTVRVSPALTPLLPLYFGRQVQTWIAEAGSPDDDGWLTLTLPFENLPAARSRLLGFGRAVEILAPEPLRLSVIDFAAQIVDFYGKL